MLHRAIMVGTIISAFAAPAAAQAPGKSAKVTWKKTIVDKAFRSEGVGIADVNKDGKKDIVVGDVWYEAPDWKMHVLAKERRLQSEGWGDVIDKGWSPVDVPNTNPRMNGYSESFCVFPDDFNGDGWADVIVIPFPGKACYWYENPGSKGGLWRQHYLTNSACNETPIFVDLFGTGKKVLVMGWQPEASKGNMGEMCYFVPGKDPTQPWQRISISGPSEPKKEVPGTQRFSHGLGHGDVNGDGRIDVICTGGWWEQPERTAGKPWTFHPASLSNGCADMHAYDVDGDGKGDIICSAPHWYGLWWFQTKAGKELSFIQRELLPMPATLAKEAADRKFLGKEEVELYAAINKLRDGQYRKAHLVAHPELSRMARDHAERSKGGGEVNIAGNYKGKIVNVVSAADEKGNADQVARLLLEKAEQGVIRPGFEIGIGFARGEKLESRFTLVVGDRGLFSLPSATHAMHVVDINGDGLKDLITGRRYWAHAPNPKGGGGDTGVNDPAYLYWFEAKKNKDGSTTFIPHEVDDDSGIGTAFAVEDLNGDGIPDIVVSNKRGVYVFIQTRVPVDAVPPRND